MTKSRRARALLLLALAATLAMPLAAADQGQVQAQTISYRGGAKVSGEAVAFFLVDEVRDPDALPVVGPAAPGGDSLLGIDIAADQLEALVFESHHLVTYEDAVLQADPRHPPAGSPDRQVVEKAKGRLVSQQDDFQVNVLPFNTGATVPFEARTQAGRFEHEDAIAMGTGRFQPAGPGDADVRDPGSPEFWQVRVDAPLVVHEDDAAQTDVTFTGDMVVELLGATLEGHGKGDAFAIETGVWRDAGLGTGLPVDQPAAHEQRTVFARLFLVNATVRVTLQGGSPGLNLAALGMQSQHDGEVTFLGVVGRVFTDEGMRELDSERYVLPPGHTLDLGRAPNALAATINPTAIPASTPVGSGFSDPAASAVVAVTAVLALAAAAGLGLMRRLTHLPELGAVEAAIEGQRYGRAARLAKRILRARPGSEDAMLGRAIALSKAGRAGAAIAEIHDHLGRRDASDGALHYVLGLAFLDVGREPEARVALAEAVRRTPALQADVRSRLGQEGSSGPLPTSLREAHGYA